ncbi:hypothetical protein QBC43DRAFT_270288 [Cladorrhinum sp. PSN259]|nr:hypothetical protein QBC43DRAFT_270288 [Cladorrhinum sp. PSN259]
MESPQPSPRRRHNPHGHPPIHTLPLSYLLIPPVLLSVLTALTLFQHSDTNIYMLYSQCHARSRLPFLSKIPVIGSPLCFITSFFQLSASSVRSSALLSTVLSFLSGLLTVSTIESSRICNSPNILIAYPTGLWLIFDLVGGAFVWELIILPAFFHRSKQIIAQSHGGGGEGEARQAAEETGGGGGVAESSTRHLTKTTETVAIPLAVSLGFVLPSILFLTINSPATVLIWLFFPIWVSLIRQATRKIISYALMESKWHDTLHLESNRVALAGMYLLPIVCSVASHIFWIWSLVASQDDKKEMTRSTIKFIVIDAFFVGLTVLYWILVEAGWRVCLVVVAASVILGPGAGICLGWIYREQCLSPGGVTVVAVGQSRRGSGDSHASEETPLLR